MLNWKQFDELRYADPFRPFRIVLSDGAEFLVPHRDYVWRSPLGTMVFVAIDNGEVAHFIDPLHITRFEMAKGNGRKKGRKRRETA
ncbi:MAG: hypothetical protein ABSB42_05855 [Tepidisphaeraceae bacterium]|jgi:hypothetical protein